MKQTTWEVHCLFDKLLQMINQEEEDKRNKGKKGKKEEEKRAEGEEGRGEKKRRT